jgi:chromosome segregation ATPase
LRTNILQWRAEDAQRRDDAGRLATKTTDTARVPAPEPAPDAEPVLDDYSESIFEAVGKVIASERNNVQAALDRRDVEIKALRREIKLLRDEIGLERGLAKLKTEVAEARALQPNFEGKLAVLQGQVEKQQKTIVRLRAEQSQLAYRQEQLDAQEQKNRQQVTLTAVQLTSIGAQTRTALEALRENGFDLGEMPSPSGLAS